MKNLILRSSSFIGCLLLLALLCSACATDDGKVNNSNNILFPQATPPPAAIATSRTSSSQSATGNSDSTFRGTNYTIQYNPTWKVQTDSSTGVTISDPQYPKAQLHILVQDLEDIQTPLRIEFGTLSSVNCHQDTTISPTKTMGQTTWNQSQYTCSAGDGGQSEQIRILDMANPYHNKHYSIDYSSTTNNFAAYTNNMFTPMTKTFQLQ